MRSLTWRKEQPCSSMSKPKAANHPEVTPPPAEFVALIVAAIKKHNVDPAHIMLQSFDWRTLADAQAVSGYSPLGPRRPPAV